jgi:hypothetical protein
MYSDTNPERQKAREALRISLGESGLLHEPDMVDGAHATLEMYRCAPGSRVRGGFFVFQ